MATTYQFFGETNALPYDGPGMCILRKRVNFANLLTNPSVLALAATPTVKLTSFTSLDGTASDVLQLFHIPAGTLIMGMGLSVITAGTTSGTIALGDGDSTAGWGAAKSIAAVGNQVTLVGDAYSADSLANGKLYVAADTLDALAAGAAIVAGVVEFFAVACFAYALEANPA